MRVAIVIAMFAWAAQFSGTAAADLYRWVDPETGSVKFSSYPPPWYGDETQQRRAPRVEHIPARSNAAAAPEAPAASVDRPQEGALDVLERQRKSMLQQMAASVASAARGGTESAPALQKQFEAFAALSERLDKLDPAGAAARRTETEALMQKIVKGEQR